MLAVTEVNGCQFCSFVHTKLSLKAGMSIEEIRNILAGNLEEIDDKALVAVLYGQHYADSKEQPTDESIKTLIDTYGVEKARMVEGITHVITFTNSLGIAMNLLKDRLLFRRNKESKFLTEFLIALSSMTLFPLFVILNLFKNNEKIKRTLVTNP